MTTRPIEEGEALNDEVRRPDLKAIDNSVELSGREIVAKMKATNGDKDPVAILVYTSQGDWHIYGIPNDSEPSNSQGNTRIIYKGTPGEFPEQKLQNMTFINAANVNPNWIWVAGTPYKIC